MTYYRIIELNGFPSPHIRIRQQRASATDMDTAKRLAEKVVLSPANPNCCGALIVEDDDGRCYPLLTVIAEYEYTISEHTGNGYLKFIGYRYDDDPVRCFLNYGYVGQRV